MKLRERIRNILFRKAYNNGFNKGYYAAMTEVCFQRHATVYIVTHDTHVIGAFSTITKAKECYDTVDGSIHLKAICKCGVDVPEDGDRDEVAR